MRIRARENGKKMNSCRRRVAFWNQISLIRTHKFSSVLSLDPNYINKSHCLCFETPTFVNTSISTFHNF